MRASSLVRRPQPVRSLPRRGPERGVRGAHWELDQEVAFRVDGVAAAAEAEVLHEGQGRQDRERRRVRLRRVAVAGVAQTMEDRYAYVCGENVVAIDDYNDFL